LKKTNLLLRTFSVWRQRFCLLNRYESWRHRIVRLNLCLFV
jgi:hypothetical protein